MDWVNKITAAIATRLNSHFLQQVYTRRVLSSFLSVEIVC